MQYFQMFENYLNFRRKSEHKTSVWWSSFWASTTLSRSCPRKRATNPAREGWHEKFPANPPWRKLRMRSRRSAGGTRSRCWPISRCGSTLSPTNQARARNPTSSPSERSASCSINQRIPQHNEGLSPPNWCNRLLILDKSVWRENSDRILKMRTSSDIRYVIISRAWFLSRRPSLTKVGFRIEGGWQWIRGVVGLSAVQSQF